MDFLSKYSSQILGITRIVSGLAFLEHGTTKLLNFPPGPMHPALTSLAGAGGVVHAASAEAQRRRAARGVPETRIQILKHVEIAILGVNVVGAHGNVPCQ